QELIDEVLVPQYPQLAGAEFALTSAYLALIPFFIIGLGLGAILLGYYIETVRRVRYGTPEQLPPWADWGKLFTDGAQMMGAYAVYILSVLLLLGIGQFALIGFAESGDPTVVLLLVLCCFFPLVLLYTFFVIFMTSICVVPFTENGRFMDFFAWGWVWRQVNTQGGLTVRWFMLGLAANLGFSAAQSLPVVGILALILGLAMQAPVQGHLLGQYAAVLDGREATKRKNDEILYG
ncbi:MAG: DUF4013 domain-containing protein, partial [Chloroflexota bacterium]